MEVPSGFLKKFPLPQIRIQGLMWLIGAIACTLALARWTSGVFATIVMVFVFSVLVERLFVASPPVSHAQASFSGAAANLVVLILCALLCSLAAWFETFASNPSIVAPQPFLVVLPFLFVLNPGLVPWWLMAPTSFSFGTFLFVNFYQIRRAGAAPLPMRFVVLLTLTTAFSVWWFVGGWAGGVRFQGAFYTLTMVAINVSTLLVLWGWWFVIRRRASQSAAVGFATLFHLWLFTFAFPWLGGF